jgi:DNA-binding response OmpR family regulator
MRTVALVDDQEDFLFLVARFLSGRYRVATFSRAALALEGLEAEAPDLIILDAQMPELTGYELCRRLRARPALAAVPVVFLTGSAGGDAEARGEELGAARFLCKPIEPEDLLAAVRGVLGE